MPEPTIDLSPSQMETWLDCPRKWAYGKVDGIYPPSKPAAAFGTETHEHLEGWLGKAKPLPMNLHSGKVAFALVKHLPPPRTPGLEVEQWFDFWLGSLHLRGRIDWQIFPIEVPIVGDHKTCSDLQWAKTEQDLLTDIQAGCYGHHAQTKTGKDRVSLQWNYVTTGSHPRTRPVHVEVGRSEVGGVIQHVERVGLQMLAMRETIGCKKGQAKLYPQNLESCSKFGGCPFLESCGTQTVPRQALFAELRDQALAESGVLHQHKKETPMGENTKNMLASLRAQRSAGGTTPAAAPASEAIAAPTAPANTTEAGPKVNANDAPPPPPPAKFINGEWIQPVLNRDKAAWEFPGEEPPAAPPAAPAEAAPDAPATPAAEKPKRGRVPKPTRTSASAAEAPPAEPSAAPAEPPAAPAEPPAAPAAPPSAPAAPPAAPAAPPAVQAAPAAPAQTAPAPAAPLLATLPSGVIPMVALQLDAETVDRLAEKLADALQARFVDALRAAVK